MKKSLYGDQNVSLNKNQKKTKMQHKMDWIADWTDWFMTLEKTTQPFLGLPNIFIEKKTVW